MGKKHRNDLHGAWPDAPGVIAVADSLPLPLFLSDPAGRPLHVNEAFRALFGPPPAEGWLALADSAQRADAESLWLAAAAALAPREAELGLLCPSGPVRALCRIAPVENAGRLLGWSIALAPVPEDRTEELRARIQGGDLRLREAEAALAASDLERRELESLLAEERKHGSEAEARLALAEERRRAAEAEAADQLREVEAAGRTLRARLDAAAPMLWTAGPDGIADFANAAWRAFTGAGPEEDWLGPIHPGDLARILGLWGHAVSRGEPLEAEHRLRHRDGGHRRVLTRAWPAWDESGALLGWTGSCTDLAAASGRAPAGDAAPGAIGDPDDPAVEAGAAAEAAEEGLQPSPAGQAPQGLGPSEPLLARDSARGSDTSPAGSLDLQEPPSPPRAAPPAEAAREPSAGPSSSGGEEADLDRLSQRLRSAALREALARWRANRDERGMAPAALWDGTPAAPGQVVIEIDEAGTPARLRVIRDLGETPLLRALATPAGGAGEGWRRCAASGRPAHDFAQAGLGPLGTHSLERLLLPCSAEGRRVDRLVLLMVAELPGREAGPSSLAS